MRFSVSIPTCKEGLNMPLPFADAQDVIRIVQEAERLKYHAVWGNDRITATGSENLTPAALELLVVRD